MSRAHSLPSHIDVGEGEYEYMQGLLPATVANEAGKNADAPFGCCDSSDDDTRYTEEAGYTDEDPYTNGIAQQWECLLSDIRSTGYLAPTTDRGPTEHVVGIQPEDRVLCEQTHRTAVTSLWIVNSMDWIDVEYVLRRMMQCESTECHAFHTMGYIFFRSCALGHVNTPSAYLQSGTIHRFIGTSIAAEITRAHPEGVLEVTCFAEYEP